MSDAHAAEPSTEEKPKKGKKKLVLVVLGIVGLLGGAGVPLFMMMGGEPKKEEVVEEELPHEEIKRIETADLGQFIVNLSDSSSFLKVRIMIEYDAAIIDKQIVPAHGEEGGKAHGGGASGGAKEEAGGGMHPIIASNENKLRDAVIRILSSKKADELLTTDGKGRLKEELVDGLNEVLALEEPPVTGVLFTEFIVQ